MDAPAGAFNLVRVLYLQPNIRMGILRSIDTAEHEYAGQRGNRDRRGREAAPGRSQVGGLIRMIEAGRDCTEVVTQLPVAGRALDEAGIRILSTGLKQCLANADDPDAGIDIDRPGQLFRTLA